MATDGTVHMDDDALVDFLGTGGTGVLALADDSDPYAVPVSYGFDPDRRRFFLRLGFGPDSEKVRYVTDGATARLVVYDRTGDEWRSVVAEGRLVEVADEDIDLSMVRALRTAALPVHAAFDAPEDDVEFRMYALDADSVTGRRAPDEE
jgi:hypothetical protein